MEENTSLIPKIEAQYRKDSAGETPCSSCVNFVSPDACKLVEGTISATGTCDLFAAGDEPAAPADPEALMNMLFGGPGGAV